MKVNTDPKKIEALLTRGVEAVYPKKEFLEARLKSGEQLTLYAGYDPTAPTLHIGHGITLLKLRQFQELGHKVIMLIGDFTGMIGDPTDKSSARKQLTHKEVLVNCQEYQKQASSILDFGGDNPVELRYNNEWLGEMKLKDILELASHITTQRLMERDMFQKRLSEEKPIFVHEFFYPLMQGYDSVAMKVDGEVGGNDQTFNMLVGRDLVKDYLHKEKFVLTSKLLTDSSGKKMGKSEGNMISLADSAADMFGKVMSWSDDMMQNGFELCTRVPMGEITEIIGSSNPRDAKLRLATEIVTTFLGSDAAQKGQEYFVSVIQNKDKPTDIPELKPSAYDIVTILVEAGFAKTRSDARRDIEGGGVKANDEKITSHEAIIAPGTVIQKGKRFFVKVA